MPHRTDDNSQIGNFARHAQTALDQPARLLEADELPPDMLQLQAEAITALQRLGADYLTAARVVSYVVRQRDIRGMLV